MKAVADQQEVGRPGGRGDRDDGTGKAPCPDEGERTDQRDRQGKQCAAIRPACRSRRSLSDMPPKEHGWHLHDEGHDHRHPQFRPLRHAPRRLVLESAVVPRFVPAFAPVRVGGTRAVGHGPIVVAGLARDIPRSAASPYSPGIRRRPTLNEQRPQGVEPLAAFELPDLDSNQEPAG
jgi:hypothetical protein